MTDNARRFVGATLLVGMAGTAVELLLLAHHEDAKQFIPLVLLAAATLTLVWAGLRPGAAGVRVLQVVMALLIGSGLVGVALHFQANVEFQLEVDPSASGTALFWKAARAKAPPALAPGAMVQLGLLGLLYTFRHPAVYGRWPQSAGPSHPPRRH